MLLERPPGTRLRDTLEGEKDAILLVDWFSHAGQLLKTGCEVSQVALGVGGILETDGVHVSTDGESGVGVYAVVLRAKVLPRLPGFVLQVIGDSHQGESREFSSNDRVGPRIPAGELTTRCFQTGRVCT